MGAWGVLAFDNDDANDWAYGLDDVDDLSLIEVKFDELEENGDAYLDGSLGSEALAACDVLARLCGKPGYSNAYTENVDQWVATQGLKPPPALLKRAAAAIDRVLGENSELRDTWAESSPNYEEWHRAVYDLQKRLAL